MRALTLTQPWCGLVSSGVKLVENRPRTMVKREDFGKPFALHASREIDGRVYDRIYEIAPDLLPSGLQLATWQRLARIKSSVIAVATIDRVLTAWPDSSPAYMLGDLPLAADQRRWFFGPVGYVLCDVRALATPVPCRGQQGFWTLPEDVARAVMAQVCR